ncbi:hypothetical protein EXU48_12780 [Occultella glacieicola]|uniref:DUF3168 domain-containing protein n=1 Tax=Occultella glacieicola TaxID=2518684 RepID=A0ABY2E1F1_9MICO|nr:hypothetical protein [Occultella glacieicola]TDE92439.1 hypothetical protein EXU48_12780 [Occultella glacieicola]
MRAVLRLELRERSGALLTRREAHNTVLATGGRMIADLFSGAGAAITHMSVGTSDDAPDAVDVTALANDDGTGAPGLVGETTVAIDAGAFTTEVDQTRRRVVVRVRATLGDAAAVGTLREASLMSRRSGGDVLYNRVVFPPVTKGDNHDLSLFWEVEFPYGDLQWLVR